VLRRLLLVFAVAALFIPLAGAPIAAADRAALDQMIERTAAELKIPSSLLHRVVKRESNYRPNARNGPYYGLMQILPQTARQMGYRGPPSGLLDPQTNLRYAGRYLKGAWLVSGGKPDLAVRYYARGYYYDAKRKGLLDETGLGRDRGSKGKNKKKQNVRQPPEPGLTAGSLY
jgi:soluble lytic murein transglycosylase-like protein